MTSNLIRRNNLVPETSAPDNVGKLTKLLSMDDVHEVSSIVTDTTQDSDETNQEFPCMLKGPYGFKETVTQRLINRACTPDPENTSIVTGDSESPLFPVLQLKKLKLDNKQVITGPDVQETDCDQSDREDRNDEETMSEMSQPLIPLKKATQQAPCLREPSETVKEDYDIEASQSLLPQTTAERNQLPGAYDQVKQKAKGATSTPWCSNTSNTYFKPNPRHNLKDSSVVTMVQEEKITETQSTSSSKGDNSAWGTQREISQSQGSVSAADKISARLEKLTESLSTATRQQKRVMEIAVNQCIGKLQDNVNHRLKSKSILPEEETVKKLLKTTQSCLTRLLEHFKSEQALLAAQKTSRSGPTTQGMSGSDPLLQSTLAELRQRQRELHSLLKRQQNLLDRFKNMPRNQPSSQVAASSGNFIEGKRATQMKNINSGTPESLIPKTTDMLPKGISTSDEIILTSQKTSQDQHGNLLASGSSNTSKSRSTENVTRAEGNLQASGSSNTSRTRSTENVTRAEGNLQASGSSNTSRSRSTQHVIRAEGRLIASGSSKTSRSRSVENVITAEGFPGNMSMSCDAATAASDVEETPEASQDVTTIPDTQQPYSQLTDNTVGPEAQVDDNMDATKNVVEGKSIIKSQAYAGLENAPVRSARISKRNVPWSPEQDASPRPKNKRSDKSETVGGDLLPFVWCAASTKMVEAGHQTKGIEIIQASSSEMSWLNKLHQSKDPAEQSQFEKVSDSSGMATEASAGICQNTNIQSMDVTQAKGALYDKVADVVRSGHAHHIEDSTKHQYANQKSDARKLTSECVPSNIADTRISKQDTLDIPQGGAEMFDVNKHFVKPLCFMSPPQLKRDVDISSNVSPTATSMSSDVFLVKAKELNRRMKIRKRLAVENAASKDTYLHTTSELTNNYKPRIVESWIRPIPSEISKRDTITEAIDSVIAKSMNITNVSEALDERSMSIGQHVETEAAVSKLAKPVPTDMPAASYTAKEPVNVEQYWTEKVETTKVTTAEIGDRGKDDLDLGMRSTFQLPKLSSQNQIEPGKSRILPPLKQLLQSGKIEPGKNCLSVLVKGVLHIATLKPSGKIRTSLGLVFVSPMQWLSTLTHGEPKKKRTAYAQILYKQRSLLDICIEQQSHKGGCASSTLQLQSKDTSSKPAENQNRPQDKPITGTVLESTTKAEKAVQANIDNNSKSELGVDTPVKQMSASEAWLNKLLSTSVVRLLTDRDLVPCDDLPDNFWTDDYSKLRLSVDMWNTVDNW